MNVIAGNVKQVNVKCKMQNVKVEEGNAKQMNVKCKM
jgi:hypothetical protein